jgi:hypothetical protein
MKLFKGVVDCEESVVYVGLRECSVVRVQCEENIMSCITGYEECSVVLCSVRRVQCCVRRMYISAVYTLVIRGKRFQSI